MMLLTSSTTKAVYKKKMDKNEETLQSFYCTRLTKAVK